MSCVETILGQHFERKFGQSFVDRQSISKAQISHLLAACGAASLSYELACIGSPYSSTQLAGRQSESQFDLIGPTFRRANSLAHLGHHQVRRLSSSHCLSPLALRETARDCCWSAKLDSIWRRRAAVSLPDCCVCCLT